MQTNLKFKDKTINELIVLSRSDSDASLEIIARNINLIKKVVHSYASTIPFDDLVQEGIVGMLEAIKRFNEKKSVKFTTFAYHYVKGAVLDYIISFEKTIRMPDTFLVKVKLVEKIKEEFLVNNGRYPSYNELLSLSGLSNLDLNYVINFPFAISNYQFSDISEINIYDFYPSEYDLERDVIDLLLIKKMKENLKNMQEIEKVVLKFRYGLDNKVILKYGEIAKRYNTSISTVRRIEANALSKLREHILEEKVLER